jgi:hypothetical protein
MAKNSQDFKKVFVSYVRDNSDEIDKLCDIFRINKIEYWLDRDQVEAGKLWKKAIRDAINNGEIMGTGNNGDVYDFMLFIDGWMW